jgi:hypothetical protein
LHSINNTLDRYVSAMRQTRLAKQPGNIPPAKERRQVPPSPTNKAGVGSRSQNRTNEKYALRRETLPGKWDIPPPWSTFAGGHPSCHMAGWGRVTHPGLKKRQAPPSSQNDEGTPLWHVTGDVPIAIWVGGATVIPRRGHPSRYLGPGYPLGYLEGACARCHRCINYLCH